jgi:hypothetical protein
MSLPDDSYRLACFISRKEQTDDNRGPHGLATPGNGLWSSARRSDGLWHGAGQTDGNLPEIAVPRSSDPCRRALHPWLRSILRLSESELTTIEAGDFITIMGPSGGAKTTLMKIMLGLLEPTMGEVLIDGIPLSMIGPRSYREQLGAVM